MRIWALPDLERLDSPKIADRSVDYSVTACGPCVLKNDLVINAQTSYRARETGGIIQDQRMLTGSCEGNRGPLRDRSAYLECRACVDLVLSSSAQIAIDNQRAVGNDLSNSTVIDCK